MLNVTQSPTRSAPPQPCAQPQGPAPKPSEASKPAPETERGFFGNVADVFIGGGQAIGDTVSGLFTAITHPIDTLSGIGHLITHPGTLVDSFTEPYKHAMDEGRPGLAIGRGIVAIGAIILPGGGIASALGGAKGHHPEGNPQPAPAEKKQPTDQAAKPSSPHGASTTPHLLPHASSPAGSYQVKPGDSLLRIAKQVLGNENRWRELYDLNKAAIGENPNRILAGTKLVLPAPWPTSTR